MLVSAPGAVGKTTLAKQIAYETHSIYVDLSAAEPVGGSTLSGSLYDSGLSDTRYDQIVTLIDGLDEARLKVTHDAFEAFLKNVAKVSSGRKRPTVIFGRTAAIRDARLLLYGSGVKVAGLEIGYYDFCDSVELADLIIGSKASGRPHASTEKEAAGLLLEKLRRQTQHDGSRFAGYAPVIHAVAMRVSGESNASKLISQIKRGDRPVTLKEITSAILEREQEKLSGLEFKDPILSSKLYTPDEQVQRLIAHIYNLQPPQFPSMNEKDAKRYSDALEKWVPEHPFLDGGRSQAATSVFDAVVSAKALRNPVASELALERELGRGAAANPFLSEFYVDQAVPEPGQIPGEHVGVIYSSLRASLSVGDAATLIIDEVAEPTEEEDEFRSDAEIVIQRGDNPPRTLPFRTDQYTIRLGAHVEDVDIAAPYANVVIGPGQEATLVSPVNIQCEKITISTGKLVVEPTTNQQTAAVVLHADEFAGGVNSVPVCRGGVELSCISEGALGHPWTSFSATPELPDDPGVKEALRRFRKFVIAFRSHGKGSLARYRGKLEHSRMTKGHGGAVLEAMVRDGIVTLEKSMYFLNASELGRLTGVTYKDCMAGRFQPKAIDFVQRAIGAP